MPKPAKHGQAVDPRLEVPRQTVPFGVLFGAVIYLGFGVQGAYRLFRPWLDTRSEAALWQSGAVFAAVLVVVFGLFFLQRWAWWVALVTVLLPLLGICGLMWMAYGPAVAIGPEDLQRLVPFAPVVSALLLVATVMLVEPASRSAFRAARDAKRAPPEPERPKWPEVEVIRDGWR